MNFIITHVEPEIEENPNEILDRFILFKNDKMIYPFRLFDGDNILYFEGVSTVQSSFEPLDNFGWEYGCTDIKFLKNNVWESI